MSTDHSQTAGSRPAHIAQTSRRADTPAPVFIIGVMNRSGTNFLANLLLEHPQFQIPEFIWEDYFLADADLLEQYVEKTSVHWSKKARSEKKLIRSSLLERFGATMLSFARERTEPGKRLLFKTPVPWNLSFFPEMFNGAYLILVMRDGRDVAASAARTFTYAPPKHWMARWAAGTRTILSFLEKTAESYPKLRYVRFEDLVQNPKPVIRDLLDFIEAPAQSYQWQNVESLPVRGSSALADGGGKVHWEPVERPKDFNPIGRWKEWSYLRKRQFKRLAGAELIKAGYVSDNTW